MTGDTPLPFDLPAVDRKKLTVDFNGGAESSDGGLLLFRVAEHKLGVCRWLAAATPDRRDQDRIVVGTGLPRITPYKPISPIVQRATGIPARPSWRQTLRAP
jgi:Transposase DDE domain group 1